MEQEDKTKMVLPIAPNSGDIKTGVEYRNAGTSAAPTPINSTSDITQIYEVLAPMAGQYANAQAEQIGQAQRSMGPLAAATMGTTTSGLGNYTYNRLMRPQVDVMRDEILVEGYRNQLNRALSDAYNTARRNYNRRSSGGGGSGGSGTTSSTTNTIEDEIIDSSNNANDERSQRLYLTGSEAYASTIGHYDHKLSREELQNIFDKYMTDDAYKTYENLYERVYDKKNLRRSK